MSEAERQQGQLKGRFVANYSSLVKCAASRFGASVSGAVEQ